MEEKELKGIEEVKNKLLEAEINLRKVLTDKVPADVLNKLDTVNSDVECCKILAENGVNLDEIEKIIADHGFNMNKICLQLPESELAGISGGFYDSTYKGEVVCPICGTSSRGDFSKQIFRSMLAEKKSYYRCKKCNQYFSINGVRSISELGNEKEFTDHFERIWGF